MVKVTRDTADKQGRIPGPLEQEILELLWDRGEASGKEIHAGVSRKRPLALTTVLTVLDRLVKKGLVLRGRKNGVYLFTPSCTREEFARRTSRGVLREIIGISATGAVASLVDILAETGEEELDRLSAMIEAKKKEMKG